MLFGFQFLATVMVRAFTGDKEISFMPEEEIVTKKLIKLDDLEPWFKAMAEGTSKQSPKAAELGE